jgi:hypothetical protein
LREETSAPAIERLAGEPVANADIHPPKTLLETHPGAAAMLYKPAVSEKFAGHEARAVNAKGWYTRLGVFSLAAIFLTMVSLIYAVTIAPSLADQRGLTLAFGVLGALGIAAQIGLLATPLKRRWLAARFAAERLRGIKFQAFAYAASEGGEEAAKQYTEAAIGKLDVELDRPIAAMYEFDPDVTLGNAPRANELLTPSMLAELRQGYRILRLDYQINHARHCITTIREESRLPAAASEISFWLGAGLGYIDLILSGANVDQWSMQRQFFTLFFFVLSAILFVLERGRSHNAALERYEDYAKKLAVAARALDQAHTPAAFIAAVREAELAALGELKAFCREAEKSTYLF